MPLKSYDYMCRAFHVIDYFDWDNAKPDTIACPTCGEPAEQVWIHSPGMSPDKFWSGINVEGVGYVTSRSDLHTKMEAKGQGFYERGVFDQVKRTKKQIAVDNATAKRKVIEDTLLEHKEILQDEFHKRRLHPERYRPTLNAPPVNETQVEFKDFNIPDSKEAYEDYVNQGTDIKEIFENVN